MDEDTLFPLAGRGTTAGPSGQLSDQRLLGSLRAFVAPIAANSGAVTEDPAALQMAREMSEAFADHPGLRGMTKSEVHGAMARRHKVDADLFESRFKLFVQLGLIKPFLEKKNQTRYHLAPSGMVGLLVFERLGATGGVDEMLGLLDRTRSLIESGAADRDAVVGHLRRCRQMLTVYGSTLARLIETAPITELVEEQRHHDPGKVEAQVHALNQLVTDRFKADHDLGEQAFQLVEANLSYRQQVFAAVDRVLDQGGASLDFTVLTPEQYLSAAVDGTTDQLAAVGSHLVIDPPIPWPHPGTVLEAIDEYAPRVRLRGRPPEPADRVEADPLGEIERRHSEARLRRRLSAELHLQGAAEVEMTDTLRALRWPAAAVELAHLLALAHDPGEPFALEMGQALLVDSQAPVTYFHPISLRRTGSPTAAVGGHVRGEPAPGTAERPADAVNDTPLVPRPEQ
jgi:hypothetical protein